MGRWERRNWCIGPSIWDCTETAVGIKSPFRANYQEVKRFGIQGLGFSLRDAVKEL